MWAARVANSSFIFPLCLITKPTCSIPARAKMPKVGSWQLSSHPFRHVVRWGLSRRSRSVVRFVLRNHRRIKKESEEEEERKEGKNLLSLLGKVLGIGYLLTAGGIRAPHAAYCVWGFCVLAGASLTRVQLRQLRAPPSRLPYPANVMALSIGASHTMRARRRSRPGLAPGQ
ncbi:hypothetical protein ACQKWADRAFT_55945 [Trichoderma austrokoningii]